MSSEHLDIGFRSAAGSRMDDIFIGAIVFRIVLEVIELHGGLPFRSALFHSVDIERSGGYSVGLRCHEPRNSAAAEVLADLFGSVDHHEGLGC